jgi:hypothetical protein
MPRGLSQGAELLFHAADWYLNRGTGSSGSPPSRSRNTASSSRPRRQDRSAGPDRQRGSQSAPGNTLVVTAYLTISRYDRGGYPVYNLNFNQTGIASQLNSTWRERFVDQLISEAKRQGCRADAVELQVYANYNSRGEFSHIS